jgi:3-hydroxyisobutyrate dehydrogenase-like beta-hydroxyacid dehydrogenase
MKIGFIGLGNMGLPMAQNLLKAGYDLIVYNRTPDKASPLTELGVPLAASPKQGSIDCDAVITMMADDKALEAVTFGDDGILNGLGEGGIHISSGTISVALAAKLSEVHKTKKQHYLSAPVIGRPDAAKNAKLRILLAGPEIARQEARPILEALGQQIFDFGNESSKANAVKLGVNFLIVSMLESFAEVQALIAKHDIEPKEFMDVVYAFFQSPVYQNYGTIMTEQRFDPAGFLMTLGLKDVGLALDAARDVNAALPLGELVQKNLEQGVAAGRGELDWTALLLNYLDRRYH